MDVYLYTFAKRPDSTKTPASAAGVKLSAVLKDGTSVLSPVLMLRMPSNPTGYNYLYIPEFRRYYWINDWVANNGVWSCACTVDVLASWRQEIGNSTQYVLRAESECDPDILDTLYATKGSGAQIRQLNQPDHPPIANATPACYVIGLYSGTDNQDAEGLTYIALDPAMMAPFLAIVYDPERWSQFDGWDAMGMGLMQFVFNPAQYIASIMAMPYGYPEAPSANPIKLGWFVPFTLSCKVISERVRTIYPVYIKIPRNPNATGNFAYRNLEPYARYKLWFPPFGLLSIDSVAIYGADYIMGSVTVDFVTGRATGELTAVTVDGTTSTNRHIGTYHAQAGVPVTISAGGNKLADTIAAVGETATDALRADPLGAAAGIRNVVGSVSQRGSAITFQGDFSEFAVQPYMTVDYLDTADTDPDGRGFPLCQNRRVSDLGGFVQVADAKISFPGCTAPETQEIITRMEGGIHYE